MLNYVIDKETLNKFSMCIPTGNSYSPPRFNNFQQIFAPIAPYSRATKNLLEIFYNLVGQLYDRLWRAIFRKQMPKNNCIGHFSSRILSKNSFWQNLGSQQDGLPFEKKWKKCLE